MKKNRLSIVLLIIFGLFFLLPQNVWAAQSSKTETIEHALLYNVGSTTLPFRITSNQYTYIDGYVESDGSAYIQKYHLFGVIRNYKLYPFTIYHNHNSTIMFDGNSNSFTIYGTNMLFEGNMYSPDDKPWTGIGYANILKGLGRYSTGKLTAHSTLSTSSGWPNLSNHSKSHTFWNNGWK